MIMMGVNRILELVTITCYLVGIDDLLADADCNRRTRKRLLSVYFYFYVLVRCNECITFQPFEVHSIVLQREFVLLLHSYSLQNRSSRKLGVVSYSCICRSMVSVD